MIRPLRWTTVCLAAVGLMSASLCGAVVSLPGIQGVVYHDRDADGRFTPGEGVRGAQLHLYRAQGDGGLDLAGDATRLLDLQTDAEGRYELMGLDPTASYYLQQEAQTIGPLSLVEEVRGPFSPASSMLLIDSFLFDQSAKADPFTPAATSSLNSPSAPILGQERDLYVELNAGVGEAKLRVNAFGLDRIQYDTAAGVAGRAVISWDGVDASASPVPSMGLEGIDLTEGGKNTGLLMKLGIDRAGAGERITFRLFRDDATTFSEASVLIPVTGGTAAEYAFLPFDEFAGPVTADRVDAIQMILGGGGPKSIDFQLDFLAASGAQVEDFVVIPEPASGVLFVLSILTVAGPLRRRSPRVSAEGRACGRRHRYQPVQRAG